MNLMRSVLLAASQNAWLRQHATNYSFVRRSVSRFMPGESLQEALAAAVELQSRNIATVFTALGENIKDAAEAAQVADHYVEVLDRIAQHNLNAEISVKLTQLGLDLSPELCFAHLRTIMERSNKDSIVWIDMESSNYVDSTLALYRRVLHDFPNAGLCLQAYLHRTKNDLESLLPFKPSIRLVKGAYNESPSVAFARKHDVDTNYFALAKTMLCAQSEKHCVRAAFGTHDTVLIRRIAEFGLAQGMARREIEVQMLYGIQRHEQQHLANEGCRSAVLIAYGKYWYPWFMRRLAERPANLWFILRQIFKN